MHYFVKRIIMPGRINCCQAAGGTLRLPSVLARSQQDNGYVGLLDFWMPGFMQFITGVYLLVGMTWFNVFGYAPPLYMAALAFLIRCPLEILRVAHNDIRERLFHS